MYTRALDRIFRVRSLVGSIRKAFSPRDLFSRGEQGVLFNPNDTSTLFEDTAGTIPTALERPVGLMLDQSRGLVPGPELVTNGAFDSNINGWTPQASVTASRDTSIFPSGALKLQVNSASSTFVEQSLGSNFIVGRKYKATATVYTSSLTQSNAGAAISFVSSTFTGATSVAQSQKDVAQTLTIYFTATSTTHSIYLAICTLDFMAWGGTGSVAYFDNISVREIPGNHAYQLTSTKRPVLTRRVNLSTATRNISAIQSIANNYVPPVGGQYWAYSTMLPANPLLNNTATAPDGSANASNINSAGTGDWDVYNTFNVTPGVTYQWSGDFKLGTATNVVVTVNNTLAWDTVEGSKAFTASDGLSTSAWVRLSITFVAPASGKINLHVGRHVRAGITQQTAGTFFFANHDLRQANFGVGLPAYQRVGDTAINAADYDITGFPAWLRCSGGQSMVTPSINFTGTDKMTVFAGVRKLSGSGSQSILETSQAADASANDGSFYFITNEANAGGSSYYLNGTSYTRAITPAVSVPVTEVNSVSFDFTKTTRETETVARINGIQQPITGPGGMEAGNGPFGNYPLYLFARNQSGWFFNGLAGPIIVRGAQSSAEEIANAENWINAQQKVYKP